MPLYKETKRQAKTSPILGENSLMFFKVVTKFLGRGLINVRANYTRLSLDSILHIALPSMQLPIGMEESSSGKRNMLNWV